MKTLLARLTAGAFLASLLIAPALPTATAGLTPLTGAFTYQGRLRVGGNNANGLYDFRFTLWNDDVGGAQIGGLSPSENVNVVAGLFTTTVNFGVPAFVGDQRWLQIEVRVDGGGLFTLLSPRQELTATPYSLFALGASAVADGGLPPSYAVAVDFKNPSNEFTGRLVDVRNLGGTATIELSGGAPGQPGTVELFHPTTANTTVHLLGDDTGLGGRLQLSEENGVGHAIIEPDVQGSGTFVFFQPGMLVDGNVGGSGNPAMILNGTVSDVTFDTNAAGNASVALPADAIAAAEILDEPGVANNHLNSVALTTSFAALASRTITCPTAGFVLVLAQGDLQASHVNGTLSVVAFGVTTNPAVLPVDQDVHWSLPAAATGGNYNTSAAAHGLFAVAAGANTFHFSARIQSGPAVPNFDMFDIQLTCVFFPTAYGTTVSNDPEIGGGIAAAPPAPGASPNVLIGAPRGPLTEAEIAQEQQEAAAFNAARLQRELLAMQAQMAALQRQLDQVLAEQGHASARPR